MSIFLAIGLIFDIKNERKEAESFKLDSKRNKKKKSQDFALRTNN